MSPETTRSTARLRRAGRAGRTIGAFGLVPVLAVVTPLIVVPVISRTAGAAGIIATAVGQSVGGVAGIAVALGWPMIGPALVARSPATARTSTYRESLRMRLRVLAVLGPVAFAVGFFLVTEHRLTAGLCGLAFAGYGLTATWFYSGSRDARGLIVADTLPRVVATALAGGALAVGAPLAVYPLLLIGAVVVSLGLNSRRILGTVRVPIRGTTDLRAQLPATGSRLLHGLYAMGSVSIVAALSATAAFPFAAYNRVQRPALGATAAFSQALVGWVGGDQDGVRARIRTALAVDLVCSLVVGALVYVSMPLLLRFLFGDLLSFDAGFAAAAAAGITAGSMARCLQQHGLLQLGDERYTTRLLAAQSAASLVAMVAVVVPFGALGALVVFAAGEALFCVLASVRLIRLWGRGA